jgi:hypothetical protein
LAGGVIRPSLNSNDADFDDASLVTEAAKNVPVHVALAADAKVGDLVTVLWGDASHSVTVKLSQFDVAKGVVTVPVNVGEAFGAFAAKSVTKLVTWPCVIVGISPADRVVPDDTRPNVSVVTFV